jgi:flagellar motor switch/type III secretory pathway protein FliN
VTTGAWSAPLLARSRLAREAWNTLASYAGEPVMLEDGRTSVEFAMTVPPASQAQVLLIAVEGGPQFLCVLETFPFDALFEAEIEIGDVHRLPATLRDALTEGAVALLWNAMAAERFGPMAIADRGTCEGILARGSHGDLTWLSVTFSGLLRDPVALRLGVEPDAIAEAISGAGFGARLVWPELQDVIERELYVTLGALRLSMREFRALKSGDVVILEASPSELLLLRVDSITFRFAETPDGFELIAIERRRTGRVFATGEESGVMKSDFDDLDDDVEENAAEMAADEEEDDTDEEDDEASATGQGMAEFLNVVVDFDLGEIRLPLSELQSWRQGTVVVLDAPPRSGEVSVTVRVNGQVVGAGDLVRIDDRLGIRLSRLFFS